jgi:MurNAc alpha-1-phosphate uridylyltransferase
MVLAAGRGERMRPLTDTTPKPLLPVAGKPLIGYHLEALAKAGIHDVVINLSWLGEKIRTELGDGSAFGVHLSYTDEGPVALETGGGIFNALPLLGPGPFLVVNGDTWTDIDFRTIELDADGLARLVLVPNPPHHPRGDFGVEGGNVIERDTDRYTYSGVGLFRPEFFEGSTAGRFPLLPLLKRAIAAEKLRGQVHRGVWIDIGTPERLAALDRQLRETA